MEWKTVAVTVLVVSLCFFAIPIRIEPDKSIEDVKLFENYVVKYNKSYRLRPEEYSARFKRFQRSLRHIDKLNSLRTSQESAFYGLTKYSDMSEEEFVQETLSPDISTKGSRHIGSSYHREHHGRLRTNRSRRSASIPARFDWREKGVITPVRSQGSCGACWAFSTVEVAESMYAIKNGSLYSLSVQEIIDCATNNNFGCEGGDICSSLAWLEATKAKIVPESIYPLTRKTDTCKLNKFASKTASVKVVDFTCDSFVDAEDELVASLAKHGPMAAAVNALSWQNYLGGVIQYHCDGSFTNLNHAVQIVGYDKSASLPHYIVRNSWGPSFGDKGYMYIAIGSNLCGKTSYEYLHNVARNSTTSAWKNDYAKITSD